MERSENCLKSVTYYLKDNAIKLLKNTEFDNKAYVIIGKYDKSSYFVDFDNRDSHGKATIKNEVKRRRVITLRSIIRRGSLIFFCK